MRAVNLLPRDTRIHPARAGRRRVDPLLAGGAALTVLVLAAIAGGFALARSDASSAQQQLADARAELARIVAHRTPGSTTHALATPAVLQQKQAWQASVATVLSARVPYDGILAQIARVAPANVTFATVTLGASAATAAPGAPVGSAGALNLSGEAFDERGVAELLARLQLVPALTNVTLTSSTADPKTGVVTFVIAAQVTGATTAFSTGSAGAGATTTGSGA